MKKITSLAIAGLIAVPMVSVAADFDDVGRVLSVNERTERVNTPREECSNETVTTTSSASTGGGQRDVGGALLGGIAGAILGAQVGKGNGKTAGAAVGAATGAIVGDRVQNSGGGAANNSYATRTCRMIDSWQTRSLGYEVSYEYQGRTYTETLPFAPGDTLRLRVRLSPHR